MFDLCIAITTYEREDLLKSLLNDINKYKNYLKIKIFIFDDGSNIQYNLKDYDVKYIKYLVNHGKKQYWKLINDIFKVFKHISSNYYMILPDDINLKNNFFNYAFKFYESINDPKKICLNLLMDESRRGKKNWTNFQPIEYSNYYLTQWNDLCFLAEKNFFEVLNYEITPIDENSWANNENLSSLVGQQISIRLYKLNKNMYHVKNSLVTHGPHISKMNTKEREINKLIAI